MIKNYINQLIANGKSEKTIKSYKYVLNRLNNFKPIEQITKNDMIEFFTKFEGTQQTKRLFQGIIKTFFINNNKKDIVEWIQLINPKIIYSDKNTLTIEDINRLIEEADSPYWRAYIAVIFETGSRFQELQAVKWSDYVNGVIEINTTKTNAGLRRIPLIMSGSYLDELKIYKHANLKDEIIFKHTNEWTITVLNKIAKSAGITKDVNCHRFRHARASDLVRRGYNESIIRKTLGWSPNSTMISRYIHTNDSSIIDAMIGTTTEGKQEIPSIISGTSQLDELRAQINNNEEDISRLLQEIENMKKFQAEFFKNIKSKYEDRS